MQYCVIVPRMNARVSLITVAQVHAESLTVGLSGIKCEPLCDMVAQGISYTLEGCLRQGLKSVCNVGVFCVVFQPHNLSRRIFLWDSEKTERILST